MNDNEYFRKVREIVAKFFLVDESTLNEDTRLEADLHAKSIIIMQIMTAIEDEYDVTLNYMQFRRQESLGRIAAYVEQECNR